MRLGILPDLIEPGEPQQNGRHGRMHRTLKAETTRRPAANRRTQRRKFNEERLQEAPDMAASASIYVPSRREMPDRLPPLEYPGRFEVRHVSYNGGIRPGATSRSPAPATTSARRKLTMACGTLRSAQAGPPA